jgi:TrmH family RNA methyltransferase
VEVQGQPCWEVDGEQLAQLADGRSSGRLVALIDLPPPREASRLLLEAPPRATFLGLCDVRDPGNVGALIRTALASGAEAILTASGTDPFHPRAVRTSLGAVFKMPLASLPDEGVLLDVLAEAGVCALAAVARGGEALDSARWPGGKLALVMGNEGVGLSGLVRARAGLRVSIDLSERADSHCVNSAAAVCLYEIQRRRRLERAG